MASAQYRTVDVPLDSVSTGRVRVQGIDGNTVYFVAATSIPTGADVEVSFGQNDLIPLSDDVRSFGLACGSDEGFYYKNNAAVAGGVLKLFFGFSPIYILPGTR